MTDQPKKQASWDTLAQELGAEVHAPPARPVQPAAPKLPPPPAPQPAAEKPAKKRSGWDELASWFGMGSAKEKRPEPAAPPPQPVSPPVPPAPVMQAPAAAPSFEQQPASRGESREPRRHEGRGDRRGDRFERRPPRRDERAASDAAGESRLPPQTDAAEASVAPGFSDRPSPEPRGEGDEGEPRRRRRRRRGGRGRGRRDREERPEGATPAADRGPAVDDRSGYEIGDEHDAPMIADDVEVEPSDSVELTSREDREPAGDGEDEPRRRRRRRRRRSGRGGRDRDAAPASGDAEPHDDGDQLDAIDVDEEQITRERIRAEGGLLDDDVEEPHLDGDDGHHPHHSIPTWNDAVSMIINVNLEARAKNPHVNSGPYRGGRGRGRGGDRGGRGRG